MREAQEDASVMRTRFMEGAEGMSREMMHAKASRFVAFFRPGGVSASVSCSLKGIAQHLIVFSLFDIKCTTAIAVIPVLPFPESP